MERIRLNDAAADAEAPLSCAEAAQAAHLAAGDPAMVTLSATLGYNGAPFCGFARQPGLTTVQGELEHALELVFRAPVPTVCAGRTDAGVHARGQVISFDVPAAALQTKTLRSLVKSLNALTHDGIVVRDVQQRPDGFSARFDAIAREYRYFVTTGPTAPLFLRDFSWHVPGDLRVDSMRQAAALLEGEHDFKSFCTAASAVDKPTHRNVMGIEIEPVEIMGENALQFTIVGNAFLHSMVRTIMGTLMMVGRGKREAAWVEQVLAACDRGAAGENAPARGLVFWNVTY